MRIVWLSILAEILYASSGKNNNKSKQTTTSLQSSLSRCYLSVILSFFTINCQWLSNLVTSKASKKDGKWENIHLFHEGKSCTRIISLVKRLITCLLLLKCYLFYTHRLNSLKNNPNKITKFTNSLYTESKLFYGNWFSIKLFHIEPVRVDV